VLKSKKPNAKVIFSVVIGSYNRKKYLKKVISNVRDELLTLPVSSEIIVVDGGSSDGSLSWLIKQKDIITIAQHNRGEWKGKEIVQRSWGYFMNLAFKCAEGKYVCMLSDDSILVPESLKKGFLQFERFIDNGQKVGAIAFHWRNWPTYDRYFVIKVKGQVYLNHGIYLKKALDEVGYINEDDYKFYCADTDLSFRLVREGYSIETSSEALVEHSQHILVKVRQANKGKGKERLLHDEKSLQKNWKEFFDDVDYKDVVEYVENYDIVPDDKFAKKHFGRAYKIECLRERLRYWLISFPREVVQKILHQ